MNAPAICRQAGFKVTVFEKQHTVGGVWLYRENDGPMYTSLVTNLPKVLFVMPCKVWCLCWDLLVDKGPVFCGTTTPRRNAVLGRGGLGTGEIWKDEIRHNRSMANYAMVFEGPKPFF